MGRYTNCCGAVGLKYVLVYSLKEMGNSYTTPCFSSTLSALTDDELMAELKKHFDDKVEQCHTHIILYSNAVHEYYRRFTENKTIKLEKLKEIIGAHKRPYMLSMGPFNSFVINFVIFPTS